MLKRRKLKIVDLIDESFKGSYVLRIHQVYVARSKTITLSVEEIMATELNTSDESSLEEADQNVSDILTSPWRNGDNFSLVIPP